MSLCRYGEEALPLKQVTDRKLKKKIRNNKRHDRPKVTGNELKDFMEAEGAEIIKNYCKTKGININIAHNYHSTIIRDSY